MCEPRSEFELLGYTHLPGFLDTDNCKELVVELQKLIDNGASTRDKQCPGSDAIHGTPVFDSLLEQLLPYFEQASGKKLFPTYAYARMYRPGEVLKVHIDRPSCEISATLTLGFEGKPWPIYMADKADEKTGNKYIDEYENVVYLANESEINMAVGDAVMYRGCDKYNWRNAFEGEWQAQVFLHYVDAAGPHASHKYDGRAKLSHHDDGAGEFTFMAVKEAIPRDACAKLIAGIEQVDGVEAGIGGTEGRGVIDKEIRDVMRTSLPTFKGIGATLCGIGMQVNQDAWKFDVTHANQTDYLKYDKDGHYSAHIDTFFSDLSAPCRKLTVLAFLNDDFEGGRLFIQVGHEKMYPPQSVGTVLVFPSFLVHGVEPVTSGIRRSIVTWLVGPWFK
jgi:predicted 2-oxoglutarate/Fe(II)-dependent dioxygenase YbiX